MNMNKQAIAGWAFLAAAAALAVLCLADGCAEARNLVGKAVWYLPYAAAVAGVWKLKGAPARRKFPR